MLCKTEMLGSVFKAKSLSRRLVCRSKCPSLETFVVGKIKNKNREVSVTDL